VAKIVVIDDEASWLALCDDKLTALGHQVRTSGNCAQALGLIRADPPDAVVMDLRMPVSGHIMILAIREEWPAMPVIIHTVYSGYRNDLELLKTNAFAVKSPDLAELIAVLDRVLARSRPAAETGTAGGRDGRA
jgi:DNA-binding NtrC family response regulator